MYIYMYIYNICICVYICVYIIVYIYNMGKLQTCMLPSESSGNQPWLAAWESIKYRHLKRTRVSIAGFDDH
jgi:hypothetical protein